MAAIPRVADPQHLIQLLQSQPFGGFVSGPWPPSPFFEMRSGSELGSPERAKLHEPPSNSHVSSIAPTAPAPAREARDTVKLREPRFNPVHLAQSKRFAEAALEHYNKRSKVKFELVDVVPCNSIPEPHCCYTHINFTAMSSKDSLKERLFFAELYYCRRTLSKKGSKEESSVIGRKLGPRSVVVTCCEPLGSDSFVGRKKLPRDDTSVLGENTDYCYGCTQVISHPKGEKYVAGHCNIPHIYDCLC